MESIGEVGTEIDFNLLNEVAKIMQQQTPGAVSVEEAASLLENFQKRDDLINFFIPAMESEILPYAKYFVVRGMRSSVKRLWSVIDPELKEQTKAFIFSLIPSLISSNISSYLVLECNRLIVDIALLELPSQWPSFIPDLRTSAEENPQTRTNTFDIFSLLVNAVDDSDGASLTTLQVIEAKTNIKQNFEIIMEFINQTIAEPADLDQVKAALNFMVAFMEYIDPIMLCETGTLTGIFEKYSSEKELSVTIINLLVHVLDHPSPGEEFGQYIPDIFDNSVTYLHAIVGDDFSEAPDLMANEAFQESFITAVTSFLVRNSCMVCDPPHDTYYHQMLRWIYVFTTSDSESIFMTVVEFWRNFLRNTFLDTRSTQTDVPEFFLELFSGLRRILVEKMPSPFIQRTIIDSDEREHIHTVSNSMFGSKFSVARECIVFLTNFNEEDMLAAVTEAYQKLQENELDINQLASLCWATGAVAGTLKPEVEAEFFPVVIQNLFAFNNSVEDFSAKVAVAKGISFICSNFYKFLSVPEHFVVFKAVFEKIFEFLNEPDQILQAFAIDSLRSLSHRCKPRIVEVFPGESKSILVEMLEVIDTVTQNLSLDNFPDFYEMLAILIQGCVNPSDSVNPQWLWENLMSKIESCGEDQGNGEVYEQLIALFRSLTKIPIYLRQTNFPQLPAFINSICEMYIGLSAKLAECCSEEEVNPIGELIIAVKSEILTFLDRMLYFGNSVEISKNIIIPIAFGPIMDDYQSLPPFARCSNVLLIICNILRRLTPDKDVFMQNVIEKLIQPTMEMFGDNFESYYEFRLDFFRLIGSITQRANFLQEVDEEFADTILHILMFGCRHFNQPVSDSSVYGLSDLIRYAGSAAHSDEHAFLFLERNMLDIISFAFQMITDPSYKFSFGLHVNTLRDLLSMDFVKERAEAVYYKLTETYPNRPPEEMMSMLKELMDASSDITKSKEILRNFLSVVSRISEMDPDLYKVEREKNACDLMKYFKENVPGFVAPSSLPFEDKPIIELAKNVSALTM